MNESLKKKAVAGSGFLIFRQASINVINFTGNLILARILIPEDFGIYSLILFMITFFTMIGDGGLGAVIIRKPRKISQKILASIFTFQQLVMGIISVILAVITVLMEPQLKNPASIWLFRVSIISYFILSFRTVPVLLLDRGLKFNKVALLEISEVLSFQVTAVVLAFKGAGVWALVIGLLAKNTATLFIISFTSPWRIRYYLKWRIIRTILPFGMSFQGSHMVNLIKDSTVPVWIGATLGLDKLGFITWATTLATYPLLVSNVLSRMFFPLFSRLQNDKERLKKAVEFILRINLLFIMGVAAVLFGLAKPITIILYTDKWMPAIYLFHLLVLVNFMLGMATPLINAFNAVGKAFYTFRVSLSWAVLLWIFALILVPRYGIEGYGISALCAYLVNIVVLIHAKKEFGIKILKNILPQLVSFGAAAYSLKYFISLKPADNLWILIVYAAAGMIIYALAGLLLNGKQYITDIKTVFKRDTQPDQKENADINPVDLSTNI